MTTTTSENTATAEQSAPEHPERKEPTYLFTEKYVADKSETARRFIETRARLNANVDKANNFLVKRFYNIDHNTYLEGTLPAKTKGTGGVGLSALRRLHLLPRDPGLPPGRDPRRAGRVAQRGDGRGRKYRGPTFAAGV
jgi:hypothetical protein